ncbi:helix-turn-helix transcriptional regulator [Terrarubrum flagellatum]|uniref:helix-turn-helix transcriptional regulator n=1 Tax=Terrirubrum flagellatum TaxID=2895980 RepID=UPI003145060A
MSQHAFSVAEIGSLVDRIYDDLLGGAPLQRSVDLIRSKLSAAYAVLTIERRAQTPDRMTVVSGDDLPAEARELASHDGRMRAGDSRFGATPLFLEHAHHIAAAEAGQKEEYHLRMFRPRGESPFVEDDTSLCSMLLSHVRRALEFSARIGKTETENKLYSGVMDKLLIGAVLLDRKGYVLQTTSAASTALQSRNGLQLVGQRLAATSAKDDRALQAAVKDMIAPGDASPASRALSLTRPSGARKLGVIIQRIGADENWHGVSGAVAAVFIRDPECNTEVEISLLCELFDLTPAEAAVAHRLANGLSLEETAEALSISRNTVRAHLRSIFSKSGITRQTELVRLMLNSAAVLGPPRNRMN